jgi:uncharacterized lipoprotein NlpE involved in copper resistance
LHSNQEDDVRKAIILAIGAIALLVGCENQASKQANVPAEPKWKGLPYRISFDTKVAKPSPSGITIPIVKYTANPDALEKRASLVVQFDTSKDPNVPAVSQMIVGPVDISGAEGALPADYMELADKQLAQYLAAYKIKGKLKISVALARSSLNGRAGTAEVDEKRLSDWLPTEVTLKAGK